MKKEQFTRRDREINLDFYDQELFGNEAGEDEDPEILSRYFISKSKFDKFLSKKRCFSIVRARKGMGKSSLLSKLSYDIKNENNKTIVISVTGADLLSFGSFNDSDHLKLQNEWKKALSARINLALGDEIGFAWTDDQMALVEASELSGYKGNNLIGSLLKRIKIKQIPIEITVQSKKEEAAALLQRYMAINKNNDVWIFIDDIDSTFSADEIQKARVSSFFSACRSLVRDVKGLYIRASVRTDVWTTIRYNEDLDKCEQYTIDIRWNKTDLQKIVSKKILSYAKRNHGKVFKRNYDVDDQKDREELIKLVFTNTLSWSGNRVSPFIPLGILGAKRPRWISQLCRMSAEAAADRNSKRVGIQDINSTSKDYGRLRVNDLYKEHSHQFGQLQKLIETFSRGEKRYPTHELLSKIEDSFVDRIGSDSIGNIDSEQYIRPLQLAQLLFRIGFILLRDSFRPGGSPSFIDYDQRPELLSDPSESYEDLIWEIHPSYRGILRIGIGSERSQNE